MVRHMNLKGPYFYDEPTFNKVKHEFFLDVNESKRKNEANDARSVYDI